MPTSAAGSRAGHQNTRRPGLDPGQGCLWRDRSRRSPVPDQVRDDDGESGFTLVELMVVLVIIGLASAAVVLAIPDPRGQVTQEAERFAARALAVRDDAILQGRAMSIRIDATGSAVERRVRGRWEPVGNRAMRPVAWIEGTGIVAPNARVTFDSTGTVADPMTVELARNGQVARVEIPGDGAAHVVR